MIAKRLSETSPEVMPLNLYTLVLEIIDTLLITDVTLANNYVYYGFLAICT